MEQSKFVFPSYDTKPITSEDMKQLEDVIQKDYKLKGEFEYYILRKKPFYWSIKPARRCLFSRRNGYHGKIIFGYSVYIRLFGIQII